MEKELWFTEVDRAVTHDNTLSATDKSVYYALCYYADRETRECTPKVAAIAYEASCSQRSVYRSLSVLETRGVIQRTPRYRGHRQIASLYLIIGYKATCYSENDYTATDVEKYPAGINTDTVSEESYQDIATDDSKSSENTVIDCQTNHAIPNCQGNHCVTDWQTENTLRIFNNSLKGEACLPASAEKESNLGNPEETKNSLTGEALLPNSQLCEPEEEQEKPHADVQDSTTENPVIKAECTENHIAEETGACLPAPAEKESSPEIPEEKPLTQEEKLRRYYELRRKCEEEHRKAEAEARLSAPAEKETTPEEPKASQTEGSTLPDYLIQQYEQKRKMIEEMMKPTKEPRYVSCDVADVVADIKKPRLIKAESEKATQTPVAEGELADKTLAAKTEPMETGKTPVTGDRHISKTDNTPEPAETSDTPVARGEPPVTKEADKPAETSNNPASNKGKRSGGGNPKDIYPIDYAPDIMRPTAEYFLFKTGRKGLRWEEVSVLRTLSATQYPTRVNKEIERACERFRKRNQSLKCLTLMYIAAALKNQPTWGNKAKQKKREAKPSPELEQYPIERYPQSAEAVKAARAARLKGVEKRFDPDKAKRRSSNE